MPFYEINFGHSCLNKNEDNNFIERNNMEEVIQYIYENFADIIKNIMNGNGELILFKNSKIRC